MNISGDPGRGTGFVDVELVGGPAGGPTRVNVPVSAVDEGELKVERGGGYDHYVRAQPGGGAEVPVFTWATRTKIAE
ncbi:DUF5988 family protein [Spirillospora sp. NPDC048911]|uniref:DUF5988 family protein n=1 Tax=Spirillospora sp. NPDC048911 TaxID=3364527 RepID=UPI00371B87F1